MEFVPPMPTRKILEKAAGARMFQTCRGQPVVGRKLSIEENIFNEEVLLGGVARGLTEKEINHDRAPFLEASSNEPVYRGQNEVPIEGKPADVYAAAEKFHVWS